MLHNLFIGELAGRLGKREISSLELTRHFLSRIERLNPALNAFITLTGDQALIDAAAADARLAAPRPGPVLRLPPIPNAIFCPHQLTAPADPRILSHLDAPRVG